MPVLFHNFTMSLKYKGWGFDGVIITGEFPKVGMYTKVRGGVLTVSSPLESSPNVLYTKVRGCVITTGEFPKVRMYCYTKVRGGVWGGDGVITTEK